MRLNVTSGTAQAMRTFWKLSAVRINLEARIWWEKCKSHLSPNCKHVCVKIRWTSGLHDAHFKETFSDLLGLDSDITWISINYSANVLKITNIDDFWNFFVTSKYWNLKRKWKKTSGTQKGICFLLILWQPPTKGLSTADITNAFPTIVAAVNHMHS